MIHTTRIGLGPGLMSDMLAADGDLVVVTDPTGVVRWVNDAVETVLGWSADHFMHVSDHMLHPDDVDTVAAMDDTVSGRAGHHHVGDVRLLTADRSWRPVEMTILNLEADHGVRIVRYRDLRHRSQARTRDTQELDEVTGLATRRQVRAALGARLGTGANIGVLFMDLDGFKAVNDAHGHGVGDRVLREVADRLAHRVRGSELLARWGGDEFVVVVDIPGPATAVNVAARLHQAVTDEPYVIDGLRVELGLSLGIAVRAVNAHGRIDRPDALIAAADRAMYEAKRAGGGIVTATNAA